MAYRRFLFALLGLVAPFASLVVTRLNVQVIVKSQNLVFEITMRVDIMER